MFLIIMRYCEVCGRRLLTGRRYCHVHRSLSRENFPISRKDNVVESGFLFALIVVGIIAGVAYFIYKLIEWFANGARWFLSQPLYAVISLILLGGCFYGYYKLWQWLQLKHSKTYNMINNPWIIVVYAFLLLIMIFVNPPINWSRLIFCVLFALLFVSFIFFLIFLYLKKKFYN